MVTTADQSLVRKFNTSVVINVLRHQAPLSRAELAAWTGLNRSTISSIINQLLDKRLVQETMLQADRIGRPGMLIELNPEGGFAIGIEIGVETISIIVGDFVANVLWRQRIASNPLDGQQAILERACQMTQVALSEGLARGLRPLGIGMCVPGLVDQGQGMLMLAPNLGWRDVPLGAMWKERFHLPVFVENDGNAAALGEYYFGSARGINTLISLSPDVGLGAGILIGGKLFRGAHGYAGEIGHMTIDLNGDLCKCGKRGCLETLVSLRTIARSIQERIALGQSSCLASATLDKGQITIDAIIDAAEQGDLVAIWALEEAGKKLAIGVANLVNIFNPEMVVIGGTLGRASDILLPIIHRVAAENAWLTSMNDVAITTSAHGVETCVLGAVALVLDDISSETVFS